MSCYNCGDPNGSQTRLCPKCNEDRRSGRHDWRRSPIPDPQPGSPQAQADTEVLPVPELFTERPAMVTMICILHLMFVALILVALVLSAGTIDAKWAEFTERTQVEIPQQIVVMLVLIPVCLGVIHLLCLWGMWMMQAWGLYCFSGVMLIAMFVSVAQYLLLSGSGIIAALGTILSFASFVFPWLAGSEFRTD